MKVGEDSVVIGNVPSHTHVGDRSVVIGATDNMGNTTIREPMAVGHGAHAGKNSIAIGAFAGAGLNEEPEAEPPKKYWHEKPIGFIVTSIVVGLIVAFCAHHFGWMK